MRFLLSTIGTRGEVQPVVALASQLLRQGAEVRVCAPPDFREWIEGLGIDYVPLGPELRWTAKATRPATAVLPSPEDIRKQIADTVAIQFETLTAAVKGCDFVVACGSLQAAARTVAEVAGVPYVFAAYCAISLPSPHHAPPFRPRQASATDDNLALWAAEGQHWNQSFGPAINCHRSAAGLAPVTDVRGHIYTDRPWLAADPVLGPWVQPASLEVVETGAWILPDHDPLPPDLEAFLAAGKPPVYFGFGSIRAPEDVSRVIGETARSLGRRAIVSRGWADLSLVDEGRDLISIGDVNQQALFQRVAAVMHHGGAGTTTAAARAGAPQVVVPQHFDQPYWAGQVDRLGIGAAHAQGAPTAVSLAAALRRALEPEVAVRAKSVAAEMGSDGAEIAVGRLLGGQ